MLINMAQILSEFMNSKFKFENFYKTLHYYEEKEFSDYDINYDYYIQKVKKEIEGLLPNRNQLSLF